MQRIAQLFRDTWWLAVIVVVAAVVLGIVIAPILSIIVVVCTAPVFVYFAFMRYDREGRPL